MLFGEDPDAKAAEPHMIQHMASVDSKRALVQAAINFEYYRLLVFLHDAGKYIASARVLDKHQKYEKKGNKFFLKKSYGTIKVQLKILWIWVNDDIDPAKMEHLIKRYYWSQ